MPYKSEAQRGKFHQMLKEGKISKATVDEWDKATKGKKLPSRIGPKKMRSTDDLRAEYKRRFGK
jgi:hypothetical protein